MNLSKRLTGTYYLSIGNLSEERLDELMAKIDDLQASFDALESAVRDFMSSGGSRASALQQELDTLRADDAVDNSKLEGLQAQVEGLRSDVQGFTESAPIDIPVPEEPVAETPVEETPVETPAETPAEEQPPGEQPQV